MKKNFKKYLAILLAVVTVLSTFALASCNPNGFGKDTDTEEAKTTPSLSIETKNSPFMSLSAKTVTRATTNGNVLELESTTGFKRFKSNLTVTVLTFTT